MGTVRLRQDLIKPLPSQVTLLDECRKHEYILFGGSAGPGKSYILRWALIELHYVWAKVLGITNVRTGMFCENYPSLKDRQISYMKRQFPFWLGEVKTTQEDGLGFYIRPEYGGGLIALRNLDDPGKYQSVEFAAIAVDELTKNPKEKFDELRARKRWPGISHSPFIAASNPGGIGHAWVKKLWLDKDFSGDDSNHDPESFLFIPARGKENPFLPESYWDTLHTLPPALRKAMEDGNWDVYAGQYFPEWDRDIHVCSPFEIPPQWTKFISLDYGYEAPSSVGWYAISPNNEWYRYRELYARGLTYSSLAKNICEMTPLKERIHYAIADPAIWGDRAKADEQVGPTGGEVMSGIFDKRGFPLLRGNHDRIQGWQSVRHLITPFNLPSGKKGSKFKAFSTCYNFIRTFPSMVHDQVRLEDLDTKSEDHAADEFRYAVHTKADFSKQDHIDALYDEALEELSNSRKNVFAA